MDSVRRYYFSVTALLLVALTVAGFSDNLFTDVGQPSNSDPKFIIHGLLCGAWMIWLFVQTSLVRVGNVRLHRKLGTVGLLIAIGVTVSTVWVFVDIWRGWAAMGLEAKANRLLLPSYSVFVALALINRKRPDWHKRFMFTGTLFMLGPVLARCYDPLVVPFMGGFTDRQVDAAFIPWFASVWLAFFMSLIGYDAAVVRKVHPVTMFAFVWFGIVWTIAFVA